MIHTLLAHAGEHHETTAEAVQHSITLGAQQIFWIVLIVAPLILLLLMQLLKVSLSLKLLLLSTFLIVFSIVSYQTPGPYSVLALSVGFGIVLIQSMVSLAADS